MQIKIILHLMEMFFLLNLSLVALLEITYMFLAALNSFFRNHKNGENTDTKARLHLIFPNFSVLPEAPVWPF